MNRFCVFGSHLVVSFVVAVSVIAYSVWFLYSGPYFELSDARTILLIIICVDLVVGPLLTFIVVNPRKSRSELIRDLLCIFFLQISALVYGVNSLYQGRPVLVAFEGESFRPVFKPDIDINDISYQWWKGQVATHGVQPIGVIMLSAGDDGYMESLQLAIQGLHPAFRPSRWVGYDEQKRNVLESAKKITELSSFLKNEWEFKEIAARHDLSVQQLRYLPLVTDSVDKNWIVILNGDTAEILGYLPINGWE